MPEKKPYTRPKMTKKRVPSQQAEQEAEKKGLSGKTRRAYIGGAINRAKQEKKTGHAAAPKKAAKKAYEKPALKKTNPTTAQAKEMSEARRPAYEKKRKKLENLPALTGSEKQVAWAEKIRTHYIADMKRGYPAHPAHIYKHTSEGITEAANHAQHSSASWWIENRHAIERARIQSETGY